MECIKVKPSRSASITDSSSEFYSDVESDWNNVSEACSPSLIEEEFVEESSSVQTPSAAGSWLASTHDKNAISVKEPLIKEPLVLDVVSPLSSIEYQVSYPELTCPSILEQCLPIFVSQSLDIVNPLESLSFAEQVEEVEQRSNVLQLFHTVESISEDSPPETVENSLFYQLVKAFKIAATELLHLWNEVQSSHNSLQNSFVDVWPEETRTATSICLCRKCKRPLILKKSYKLLVFSPTARDKFQSSLHLFEDLVNDQFVSSRYNLASKRFSVEHHLAQFLIHSFPFSKENSIYSDYLEELDLDPSHGSVVDTVLNCLLITMGFLKKGIVSAINNSLPIEAVDFSSFGPAPCSVFPQLCLPYTGGKSFTSNYPATFAKSLLFYVGFIAQKIQSSCPLSFHQKLIRTIVSAPGIFELISDNFFIPIKSQLTSSVVTYQEALHVLELLVICYNMIKIRLNSSDFKLIEGDLLYLYDKIPINFVLSSLVSIYPSLDLNSPLFIFINSVINIIFKTLVLLSDSSVLISNSAARVLFYLSQLLAFKFQQTASNIVFKICNFFYSMDHLWSLLAQIPFDCLNLSDGLSLTFLFYTGITQTIPPLNSFSEFMDLNPIPNSNILYSEKGQFIFDSLFNLIRTKNKPISFIVFRLLFNLAFLNDTETILFKLMLNFTSEICSSSFDFLILVLDFIIETMPKLDISLAILQKLPKIQNLSLIKSQFLRLFQLPDLSLAFCLLERLDYSNFENSEKSELIIVLLKSLLLLKQNFPFDLLTLNEKTIHFLSKSLKVKENDFNIRAVLYITKIISSLFLPSIDVLKSVVFNNSKQLNREYFTSIIGGNEADIIKIFNELLGGPIAIQSIFSLGLISLPLIAIIPFLNTIEPCINPTLFAQITIGDFFTLLTSINRFDLIFYISTSFILVNLSEIKIPFRFLNYLSPSYSLLLTMYSFAFNNSSYLSSLIVCDELFSSKKLLTDLENSCILCCNNSQTYNYLLEIFRQRSFDKIHNQSFDSILVSKLKIKNTKKRSKLLVKFPYTLYFFLDFQFKNIEVPRYEEIVQLINNSNKKSIKMIERLSVYYCLDEIFAVFATNRPSTLLFFYLYIRAFNFNSIGSLLIKNVPSANILHQKMFQFLLHLNPKIPEIEKFLELFQNNQNLIDDVFLPFSQDSIINSSVQIFNHIFPNNSLSSKMSPNIPPSIFEKRSKFLTLGAEINNIPSYFSNSCHISTIFSTSFSFNFPLFSSLLASLSELLASRSLLPRDVAALNTSLCSDLLPNLYDTVSSTKWTSTWCMCGGGASGTVSIEKSVLNNEISNQIIENRRKISSKFNELQQIEQLSAILSQLFHLSSSLPLLSFNEGLDATKTVLNLLPFMLSIPHCILHEYLNFCAKFLIDYGQNDDVINQIYDVMVSTYSSPIILKFLSSYFFPHLNVSLFPCLYKKFCSENFEIRSKISHAFDISKYVLNASLFDLYTCLDVSLTFVDQLPEDIHKQLTNYIIAQIIVKTPVELAGFLFSEDRWKYSYGIFKFSHLFADSNLFEAVVPVSEIFAKFLTTNCTEPFLSSFDTNQIDCFVNFVAGLLILGSKSDVSFEIFLINCFTPLFFPLPPFSFEITHFSTILTKFCNQLFGKISSIKLSQFLVFIFELFVIQSKVEDVAVFQLFIPVFFEIFTQNFPISFTFDYSLVTSVSTLVPLINEKCLLKFLASTKYSSEIFENESNLFSFLSLFASILSSIELETEIIPFLLLFVSSLKFTNFSLLNWVIKKSFRFNSAESLFLFWNIIIKLGSDTSELIDYVVFELSRDCIDFSRPIWPVFLNSLFLPDLLYQISCLNNSSAAHLITNTFASCENENLYQIFASKLFSLNFFTRTLSLFLPIILQSNFDVFFVSLFIENLVSAFINLQNFEDCCIVFSNVLKSFPNFDVKILASVALDRRSYPLFLFLILFSFTHGFIPSTLIDCFTVFIDQEFKSKSLVENFAIICFVLISMINLDSSCLKLISTVFPHVSSSFSLKKVFVSPTTSEVFSFSCRICLYRLAVAHNHDKKDQIHKGIIKTLSDKKFALVSKSYPDFISTLDREIVFSLIRVFYLEEKLFDIVVKLL
ncbi:hypothetical protein RCL1_004285 [Eukaryota sp. TZLM3-RCL]